MNRVFIIIGVAIALIVVIVLVFACRSQDAGPTGPAKLTYWRLFEDKAVFDPIFEPLYEKTSDVEIEYVEKDSDEYYNELLDILATGGGPDIFMIRNDWLPAFKDKVEVMPENVMSADEFREIFVNAASEEIISDNQIYGIPFSVDSLSLIYNERMLDDADCPRPPTNWTDFISCSKKITKLSGNRVNRAGTALGTTNNLDVGETGSKKLATDILSAMMIQSGTEMVSADRSSASFGLPAEKSGGGTAYPGTRALSLYSSFAQPSKETYSWHKNMDNAVNAFADKTVAMIFGYSEMVTMIEAKDPDFTYYSGPLPQIKSSDDPKTTAYYWIEVVSKHSQYKNQAWAVLLFLSDQQQLSKFRSATKRPPSRKDMLESASGDAKYGAFAVQSAYATTWYKGKQPYKVYDTFANMINGVVGSQKAQNAIDSARNAVTALFQKEKQE